MFKKYSVKKFDGSTAEEKICGTWNENVNESVNISYFLTNLFGLVIVLVSVFTRKLFIKIISLIKFRRKTTEKNIGMACTLAVYFIYYGLMYLLAPWDYIDAFRAR